MDSSTILIASFMIFSIGRITVSGLNFDPSFLSSYCKGEQSPFFAPSFDDRSRALLPSFQWLIGLPSAQSFWFLRMVATSPRTRMIFPARWVYIHPWISSGTVHFPAILVTVTCNPRRCVRTPLSGREGKDLSKQPPGVNFPVWAFGTCISPWKSERVTTTEDLPPNLR